MKFLRGFGLGLIWNVGSDNRELHGIETQFAMLVIHAPLQPKAHLQAGLKLHMVGEIPDVEVIVTPPDHGG